MSPAMSSRFKYADRDRHADILDRQRRANCCN